MRIQVNSHNKSNPMVGGPLPHREPASAPDSRPTGSDVVATSLSWLGGAASLAGGLTRNPLLLAAGAGAFALGSGLEARRVSNSHGLDGQFALNVGLAGSLVLGGLAFMFLGSAPVSPAPFQQFLNQHPGLGNLVGNLG